MNKFKKILMMLGVVLLGASAWATSQLDWSFTNDGGLMGDYAVDSSATYYMINGDSTVGEDLEEILRNQGKAAFETALVGYSYQTGNLSGGSVAQTRLYNCTKNYAAIFIFNSGDKDFAYSEYDVSDYLYTPPASGRVLEAYDSDWGDEDYACAWGNGSLPSTSVNWSFSWATDKNGNNLTAGTAYLVDAATYPVATATADLNGSNFDTTKTVGSAQIEYNDDNGAYVNKVLTVGVAAGSSHNYYTVILTGQSKGYEYALTWTMSVTLPALGSGNVGFGELSDEGGTSLIVWHTVVGPWGKVTYSDSTTANLTTTNATGYATLADSDLDSGKTVNRISFVWSGTTDVDTISLSGKTVEFNALNAGTVIRSHGGAGDGMFDLSSGTWTFTGLALEGSGDAIHASGGSLTIDGCSVSNSITGDASIQFEGTSTIHDDAKVDGFSSVTIASGAVLNVNPAATINFSTTWSNAGTLAVDMTGATADSYLIVSNAGATAMTVASYGTVTLSGSSDYGLVVDNNNLVAKKVVAYNWMNYGYINNGDGEYGAIDDTTAYLFDAAEYSQSSALSAFFAGELDLNRALSSSSATVDGVSVSDEFTYRSGDHEFYFVISQNDKFYISSAQSAEGVSGGTTTIEFEDQDEPSNETFAQGAVYSGAGWYQSAPATAAKFSWGFYSGESLDPTGAYLEGGSASLYIGGTLIATAEQDPDNFNYGVFDHSASDLTGHVQELGTGDISATFAGQSYKLVLTYDDGQDVWTYTWDGTSEYIHDAPSDKNYEKFVTDYAVQADDWKKQPRAVDWSFSWAKDKNGNDVAAGTMAYLVDTATYPVATATADLHGGNFDTTKTVGSAAIVVDGTDGAHVTNKFFTVEAGLHTYYTVILTGQEHGDSYALTPTQTVTVPDPGTVAVAFGELSSGTPRTSSITWNTVVGQNYIWGQGSYSIDNWKGDQELNPDLEAPMYEGGKLFLYLGTVGYTASTGFDLSSATLLNSSVYKSDYWAYGNLDTESMSASTLVTKTGGQAYTLVLVNNSTYSSLNEVTNGDYFVLRTGTSGYEYDPVISDYYAIFQDDTAIGQTDWTVFGQIVATYNNVSYTTFEAAINAAGDANLADIEVLNPDAPTPTGYVITKTGNSYSVAMSSTLASGAECKSDPSGSLTSGLFAVHQASGLYRVQDYRAITVARAEGAGSVESGYLKLTDTQEVASANHAYKVKKVVSDVTTEITNSTGKLELSIPLADTATYQIDMLWWQTDSGTVKTNTVSKLLEVGTVKVASDVKNQILAVPFKEIGTTEGVKIANLIQSAGFTENDLVYVYNTTSAKYESWKYSSSNTWDAVQTVGDSVSTPDPAIQKALETGGTLFLSRQSVAKPVYLVGATAAKPASPTIAKGSTKTGVSTAIANPNMTSIAINTAVSGAGTDDKIFIPTKDGLVPVSYGNGQWSMTTNAVIQSGDLKFVRQIEVKDVTIPAGTGFWYLNRGSDATFTY